MLCTVNRVFASLAQARRNIDYMPQIIRKKVVQSLIMPILEYGLSVMTNMSKENMHILQKAQNACVRFIFKASRVDHITPYFIELQWLKITDRQILSIVKLAWKIIKFRTPMYLYEMFIFSEDEKKRTTKSNNQHLRIPIHRTQLYSNSFCLTATRTFNHYNLKDTLNHSTTISLSKQITKARLLDYYLQ